MKNLSSDERRRARRFLANLRVIISHKGEVLKDVHIENISRTGMLLRSESLFFKRGTDLEYRIFLDAAEVSGTLRLVRVVKEEGKNLLAGYFLEKDGRLGILFDQAAASANKDNGEADKALISQDTQLQVHQRFARFFGELSEGIDAGFGISMGLELARVSFISWKEFVELEGICEAPYYVASTVLGGDCSGIAAFLFPETVSEKYFGNSEAKIQSLYDFAADRLITFLRGEFSCNVERKVESLVLDYAPAILEYILLYHSFQDEYLFYFDIKTANSDFEGTHFLLVVHNRFLLKFQ